LTKKVFLFILNIKTKKKERICVFFYKDTEKEEDQEEREQKTNDTNKIQALPTNESIEFDNGFKLDLSSIDDDISDQNTRRRSIDYDYEAINRSKARVGDWETNFTLIESKVKIDRI
jgi:aconitase A